MQKCFAYGSFVSVWSEGIRFITMKERLPPPISAIHGDGWLAMAGFIPCKVNCWFVVLLFVVVGGLLHQPSSPRAALCQRSWVSVGSYRWLGFSNFERKADFATLFAELRNVGGHFRHFIKRKEEDTSCGFDLCRHVLQKWVIQY